MDPGEGADAFSFIENNTKLHTKVTSLQFNHLAKEAELLKKQKAEQAKEIERLKKLVEDKAAMEKVEAEVRTPFKALEAGYQKQLDDYQKKINQLKEAIGRTKAEADASRHELSRVDIVVHDRPCS